MLQYKIVICKEDEMEKKINAFGATGFRLVTLFCRINPNGEMECVAALEKEKKDGIGIPQRKP